VSHNTYTTECLNFYYSWLRQRGCWRVGLFCARTVNKTPDGLVGGFIDGSGPETLDLSRSSSVSNRALSGSVRGQNNESYL